MICAVPAPCGLTVIVCSWTAVADEQAVNVRVATGSTVAIAVLLDRRAKVTGPACMLQPWYPSIVLGRCCTRSVVSPLRTPTTNGMSLAVGVDGSRLARHTVDGVVEVVGLERPHRRARPAGHRR